MARGADETRNLLEMKLHGVSAEHLAQGVLAAGDADLGRFLLEVGDVALEIEPGPRHVEAPVGDAFREIFKTVGDVDDQVFKLRIQALEVGIVSTFADGKLKREQRIEKCAAKLG